MHNSSVDELIILVHRLRQEKASCEETINQAKHKARVLERSMEDVARQVEIDTMVKQEKEATMAAVKGRVESKKKMFDQVKQKDYLTQAIVKDCMENAQGETKERFTNVEKFEDEMMLLSDKMSGLHCHEAPKQPEEGYGGGENGGQKAGGYERRGSKYEKLQQCWS